MIKAVLFDMDGVLVDSEPENKRVMKELATSLGFVLTNEDKLRFSGVGAIEQWITLKNEHRFLRSPEDIAEEESHIMAQYYQKGDLAPIETSVNLLKECALRGIKIAVATSAVRINAEAVIGRLGLKGYVNAIVSGDMVEKTKPAPDIFLKAAEMLGIAPNECAVIEDSKNGIAAAKAGGMKAVGLKNAESMQDLSEADAVFSSEYKIDIEELLGSV